MAVIEQRKAVLRLLGDDDPVTVALVKEQLTERGADDLADLRELLAVADCARAAEQLREIIRTIEAREADRRFTRFCASFDNSSDLEAAAWELAATFLPGEDFSVQRTMLNSWGQEALRRLCQVGCGKVERVAVLAQFLGRDLRLRGNDDQYYLYSNSLLPRVIDTRLGIPISLALTYMFVGRRAGMAIDGVGLPGHFLARHGEVIFDPFHAGRRVSLEECTALLAQQNLSLLPQHLAPTTPRQMLIRMLTNLRYIATNADPPLAEKLACWEAAVRGE